MSAVTDFLATQGIFQTTDDNGNPVYYRNSDDGRQILRGEALDNMFSSFGLEAQGQQARDANGNLLLALDDPQKLAQAQAAGAVQYVNGIPYANYMNNRGPQGSSALFPDMPQSGLGEFLGNLALVAGPAAFGGLGGFEALGAGGAGAAEAGTVAGGGVGGGTGAAIEGGLASNPFTGVGAASYGGANSALGALGTGAGLSADLLSRISPADLGQTVAENTPLNPLETSLSKIGLGSLIGPATSAANSLTGGNTPSTLGIPNNILSGLVQGGLGYLAADQTGQAYKDVANQYLALGAPSRDRFNGSFQPGFDLLQADPGIQTGLDAAANTTARALSVNGNPADNPGAQAEIQKYLLGNVYLPQLNTYRSQNLTGGGLGVNTAGTGSMAGASTTGGGYEAIGAGVNSVLNPQPNIQDILRQLQGGNNYSLNIGGVAAR